MWLKETIITPEKVSHCLYFLWQDRDRLAQLCRPNKDESNMTEADVRSMGCAAIGFSRRELERIPRDTLSGALDRLKTCMEEADSDFVSNNSYNCRPILWSLSMTFEDRSVLI